MKTLFSVTYEIVTPESAEAGEAESSGFIAESVSLRDALREFDRTRTNRVDGIESTEPDSTRGRIRWVTRVNAQEFETGAHESRSLHIPASVSESSARRIARLCGVRS
jgi:hypothetical protein